VRDNREKLRDILEAIERIEKYAVQGRKAFEENELIQNWFIQHLVPSVIARNEAIAISSTPTSR
jgi:uncharacterized protein with HEPN domain